MPRLLLRPGWILSHVAVIAIAVAFTQLGLWQLERHGEVAAENDRLADIQDEPLALDDALAADDVLYQPTAVTGTYAQDADVRLSPRSRNELPGYEVLTPLQLADGRVLLVNRGWVPLDVEIPPAPAGAVDLEGRLRPPATARQVLPPGDGEAELVSNPDLARLAAQVPDLIPTAYMEVVDEEARNGGVLPRPADPIVLDGGDHLSYAFQWFAFTVIGLIGYPLLLRRRLADRRDDVTPTDAARGGAPRSGGPTADAEAHPVAQ